MSTVTLITKKSKKKEITSMSKFTNLFNQPKNLLKKKGTSILTTALAAGTLATTTSTSFAAVDLKSLGDAGTALQNIIDLVFLLGKFAGFVMCIFGIIQLIKFAQNHETAAPDALPKALGMLIGGIGLFFAETLLTAIGVTF